MQKRKLLLWSLCALLLIFSACKKELVEDLGNDNNVVVDRFFTDSRDGETYETVTIGTQVWMAENLRYDVPGSFLVNANDYRYGRLYTWPILMNGAPASDRNPSGVKGLCPDNWHIPSHREWVLIRS